MLDYSTCGLYNDPIYMDETKHSFQFSTSFDSSTLETPVFHYENVSDFLDPDWKNPNQLTIKRCHIDFSVPETMAGPVFMYYRLTNFYQNHRQYIKNFDADQLGGAIVNSVTLNTNCGPIDVNSDSNLVVYPCGLIANSMFNGIALSDPFFFLKSYHDSFSL